MNSTSQEEILRALSLVSATLEIEHATQQYGRQMQPQRATHGCLSSSSTFVAATSLARQIDGEQGIFLQKMLFPLPAEWVQD